MARDFFINGPTGVFVKGRSDGPLAALSFLGLSESPIIVTPRFRHAPLMVNAWGGGEVPADLQVFLADADVAMDLIDFDRTFLANCIQAAMGGAAAEGACVTAGTRMGGNAARFAPGNNYLGLNLTAPVSPGPSPWRFYYAYLQDSIEFPLGSEKSVIRLSWKVVPYTNDPWGGGSAQPTTTAGFGAGGALLWDHNADT